MSVLIAGLIIFFTVHSISLFNDAWRDQMAGRLGLRVWKGLYALVSIIGLALVVTGYGLTRDASIDVYSPPLWLRHTGMTLLIPFFPLLFAAYLPGRIGALVRHPMLAATMLWSCAHLLANGTLADILLFGTFLTWAALDWRSRTWRTPRPVPGAPAGRYNDLIAIAGGLILHFGFVFVLHELLIGVSPIRG